MFKHYIEGNMYLFPEKLGFTEEGLIRDYEFINGKYLNRVVYGLKANEWSNLEMRIF